MRDGASATVAISYAADLLVAVIYNTWFEGYFFKYLWPAEPAWDQQVLDFLPLLGVTFGNHFIRQYLRWGGSGRAINLVLHVIVIGSLFRLSCAAPTIAALEDYRRGKRGRAPCQTPVRRALARCHPPDGKMLYCVIPALRASIRAPGDQRRAGL